MSPTLHLHVPTAIEEIRNGRMIVVVDDEIGERSDLTLAAEKSLPKPSTSWPWTWTVASP